MFAAWFPAADLVDTCIVASHGTVMSGWLGREIPDLDAVSFWDQLQVPDAWLVDIKTDSVHRVVVQGDRCAELQVGQLSMGKCRR